jgi:hypothetical protein
MVMVKAKAKGRMVVVEAVEQMIGMEMKRVVEAPRLRTAADHARDA